jgi:hypothetical protein
MDLLGHDLVQVGLLSQPQVRWSLSNFDLARSEGTLLFGHAKPAATDRWIQAQTRASLPSAT